MNDYKTWLESARILLPDAPEMVLDELYTIAFNNGKQAAQEAERRRMLTRLQS